MDLDKLWIVGNPWIVQAQNDTEGYWSREQASLYMGTSSKYPPGGGGGGSVQNMTFSLLGHLSNKIQL